MRVQILKDFVKQHFPSTHLLDYALDVEKITTSKVNIQSLKHTFKSNPLSIILIFLFVSETQLDLECGWLHRCGLRGLAEDLWWFYSVRRRSYLYGLYKQTCICKDMSCLCLYGEKLFARFENIVNIKSALMCILFLHLQNSSSGSIKLGLVTPVFHPLMEFIPQEQMPNCAVVPQHIYQR